MDYAFIFLISLLSSLVLTPLVRKIVTKLGIIDIPNEKRWHREPVALLGGISVFISFMLASLLRAELDRTFFVIIIGAAVMFILGLLDDLLGTHPRIKFAFQVLVALMLIYYRVVSQVFPYYWLNVVLTVFWVAGLSNSVNMMDNIDGLSSGITIIAGLGVFALSLQKGMTNSALLCLALVGSCLGFLKYNFKPAKIFMGDCGALFLGYMLAVLAVLSGWQGNARNVASFLSPVLIMGVIIFDTALVTILRLKNGKMPWHGGTDHSSHRLAKILNGNDRGSVFILYGLGVLAVILGLIVIRLNALMAIIITIIYSTSMIIFGTRLARVDCYHKKNIELENRSGQSLGG